MTAYIIRRLLWMIPTFLGILMITFGVLRLQSSSLSQQMAKAAGEGGVMDARAVATGVENYLAIFRSTGLDLPALVNLRGFTSKEEVVRLLERTERRPDRSENKRNRLEKDLWLEGHFLVQPLAAIIADGSLAKLHGPASMALSLCAYYPLNPDDLKRLTPEQQHRRQARNFELKALRIDYANTAEHGFVTTDPKYAEKRAAIAKFWADNQDDFVQAHGRWRAILLETGFCEIMGKLFTGDLYSTKRKEYAFTIIADRWKVSFTLNFLSMMIAWCIAIPLGIRSARRVGTLEDRATTNALFLAYSLPSFFVGTLLLHHLCTDSAGHQAPFPNRGLSSPGSLWMSTPRYLLDLGWHAVLPMLVLCYASFTSLSRYMRGDMLEQLHSDYVRTARAKGADEDAIIYRHSLRNSMITMITLGAGLLSDLFGGFVVVETIFSIPGLGMLLFEAARDQDAPLIMASTIISVGLLLVGILVSDILYAVVDPRLRSRYG